MKKLYKILAALIFVPIIFMFAILIIGISSDNTIIINIFLMLLLLFYLLAICIIIYTFIREQKRKKEKIIQERKQAEEKKRQAKERIEQERQQAEERKRQELLERERLIKQKIDYELYSVPVYNFIEQAIELNGSYFYFSPHYWYPDNENSFVLWLLQRDGINLSKASFDRNLHDRNLYAIYERTVILVRGLENKQPEETKNKPATVYLIVRNNLIKYFHDKYVSTIGYEDIKAYCQNRKISDDKAKILFTYFYIYNTDINSPLSETYKSVDLLMRKEYDVIRRKEIEKSIFSNKKLLPAGLNKTITGTTKTEPVSQKITIKQIDSMSGRDFEIFICNLFAKRGYKCALTPASGDYGIDVIITDALGTKIGIQTKCYKEEKVSNDAVQEVYAGLRHYNCDKAMVITNSYFTPNAIQAARENNVTLWDRNVLIKNIQ